MDFNWIEIATLATAAAIFGVLLYNRMRGEDVITIEGIEEYANAAIEVWQDARGYVASAEQLWLTGRIEKDSRFHHVLDRLKRDYPDLDKDKLIEALEAGVYWLNRAKS